jgi:DNA-binding MarR family transcriptional regulator
MYEHVSGNELRRISRSAEKLSRMLKTACDRQGDTISAPALQRIPRDISIIAGEGPDEDLVSLANSLLRALAEQPDFGARDVVFSPAWQLFLELFVAQLEQRPVPVTNACLSLGTAQTTALRYLTDLERRGLIASVSDPADGRRRLLRLTPHVEAELRRYLRNAADDHGVGLRIRVRVPVPGREPSAPLPCNDRDGAGSYGTTRMLPMNRSTNGSIQVRT